METTSMDSQDFLPGVINSNFEVWTSTFMDALQNPDRIPIATYDQMLYTDETVYSGTEFVSLALLSRLGPYTHSDKKIEAGIRQIFSDMRGSLKNKLGEILTAVYYGYSVTEICIIDTSKGYGLDDLQTLHPGTVTFDLHKEGRDKNRLKTIWQFKNDGQKQKQIPVGKAIVYSHRGKFAQVYGHSRLTPAFKSWFLKDLMLRFWGLTLERYGAPIVTAKAPNLGQPVTYPGVPAGTTVKDYLLKVCGSLKSHSALVFDTNTEIELFYAKAAMGADFQQIIDYCNKMIYRSLLLPGVVADSSGNGSYSLGQTHFDLFALMLTQMLEEIVEILIEQLVRRFIIYNFGPQKDYGTFQILTFQPQDQKLFADAISELTQEGYISSSRLQDLNAVRERIGIDQVDEAEMDKMKKARMEDLKAQAEAGAVNDAPFKKPGAKKKEPGKTSGERTKKERSRITK